MIRLHFFDYGNYELNVEKELEIDTELIEFLTNHIQNISFEATDNVADLEDNWIYWFSSNCENETVSKLNKLISSKIRDDSTMKYQIKIDEM